MRTKTYDFRSFLNGELETAYVTKKYYAPNNPNTTDIIEVLDTLDKPRYSYLPWATVPLMTAPLFSTTLVSAQEAVPVAGEAIRDKMMSAFEPLIGLIQGMAYPVAMVVVLGGAIFVMIGNSDKGFGMMQKAGLGYLLVMIAPMVLDVLVDSMKGVV